MNVAPRCYDQFVAHGSSQLLTVVDADVACPVPREFRGVGLGVAPTCNWYQGTMNDSRQLVEWHFNPVVASDN